MRPFEGCQYPPLFVSMYGQTEQKRNRPSADLCALSHSTSRCQSFSPTPPLSVASLSSSERLWAINHTIDHFRGFVQKLHSEFRGPLRGTQRRGDKSQQRQQLRWKLLRAAHVSRLLSNESIVGTCVYGMGQTIGQELKHKRATRLVLCFLSMLCLFLARSSCRF
jgi:hypothetical protein